jgi:hypothetical protein
LKTKGAWPAATAARLACLTIVASALAFGTPTPASATSLPIADCTTSSGVILAVDFSAWGGPILRACGSTPTTGLGLINQGGWHSAGTTHDGSGFVCRISYVGFRSGAQYPTAAQQACISTPLPSASWTYWHADPGQNTWSYSQQGAAASNPQPGSIDLWIFGKRNISTSTGTPTFSPNSVRAGTSQPPDSATPTRSRFPATPKPVATSGSVSRSGGSDPTGRTSLAASTASASPHATSAATGSAPPATTNPSAGGALLSTPQSIVNAPPLSGTTSTNGSGSPVALIVGVVIAAALIVPATVVARRRRRGTQS